MLRAMVIFSQQWWHRALRQEIWYIKVLPPLTSFQKNVSHILPFTNSQAQGVCTQLLATSPLKKKLSWEEGAPKRYKLVYNPI